jgi:hypothetical protein
VPDGVIAALQRLYYDTALSANRRAMDTLLSLVSVQQAMLGSDYPYAPEEAKAGTVKGLAALGLPEDDLKPNFHTARQNIPLSQYLTGLEPV